MKDKYIKSITINNEVKKSYIDYAMSVIVSRALPDVRDGLKPVHRRILYSMYKLGIFYNKNYKKSARIVGEVLGKYHPHGDKSVYDSIVRMSQLWNIRYKLIIGQGNFGSIDNDPPAAMRYTEIKLEKITNEMLYDIKYNTVKMKSNFDDTLLEPVVLPTKIPNIIINGCTGIAVGMATNMPPHNLTETINTICKYIDNKNININKLIKSIKGPDFPTGGIILSYNGIINAYKKGKGKIIIRSKYYIKKTKKNKYLIIKEIPYQVIKSNLIKKIYDLIKIGKLEEIENIKDESNKKGIRIILLLNKNSISDIVINKLLKYTDLEVSYHINNIALVNGKPKRLNLKELISYFIKHRNEVIINKSKFFLLTNKKKLHLLKGFIKISNKINKLLDLIKKSISYKDSFNNIKRIFNLSDLQIKFILNTKLYKLTNNEIKNLVNKYNEVKDFIIKNKNIINSENERMSIIKNELLYIKNIYGDSRRTLIDYSDYEYLNSKKINLIENLKLLIILTKNGYIKRTLLSEYKTQKRGGLGSKCITIEKNDSIKKVLVGSNHYYVMFFTSNGRGYLLKIYNIPIGNKKFKGRAIQNFIKVKKKIQTYIFIKTLYDKEYIDNHYIVMVTKYGVVKRTILNKYINIRKNGIKSIILRDNDPLLEAILTNGSSKLLIAINNGKAIIFNEKDIKLTNRTTIGVKGIYINKEKDKVIGIVSYEDINKEVLVVSEHGYGKRTLLKNYRVTNRGCIGVKTINITPKTGKLISILVVSNNDDLMLIKTNGVALRINISTIRIVSRNSQGVKLIKLNKDEKIASVVLIKNKYI
ncbi:MAG: DNA gyrase subunit A [Candidatus Shikimatogenerans bostrichidophilus]|nr:MAG: DNA gyrase subunit A [Candidatus Shikimatogenerans bostrichidophilus]